MTRVLHLRRSGPEPLYYQLAQSLETAIETARIPHGTRLPPDAVVAQDLKLAVATVRSAWVYLERKGVLTRTRKTGTYIR